MTIEKLFEFFDYMIKSKYKDYKVIWCNDDQVFMVSPNYDEVIAYDIKRKAIKIMSVKEDNTLHSSFKKHNKVTLKHTIKAYPTATRAIKEDRVTAEYAKNTNVYIWKVHDNGAVNISMDENKAGGWVNPLCLQNSI